MKKTLWVILVIVVIVVIWCVSSNKESTDRVVKIGYTPNIGFLQLHIAVEQKMFEAEGVKVELVPLQSAQQLYEALVRKEIDYSPFLSTVVVMAGELVSGGNIKISTVSDMTLESPFDGLIVKKDSPLTKVEDLAGKKVGVFPGTTATNFLTQYLKGKNVDTSKIQFIPMPPANQLPALESGAIDVLFAYEPTMTTGVEKFGYRKLSNDSIYAALMNHSPFGVYIFNTAFATEYPNLVEKVEQVMDKANTVVLNDQTTARAVAKKVYNLEDAVAAKVNLVGLIPSTEFQKEPFLKFLDYLVKIGELKAAPDTTPMF